MTNLEQLPDDLKLVYFSYCVNYKKKNKTLKDIILAPDIEKKFNKFLTEYKEKDFLNSMDLPIRNKVLLYGASGTGKTFLVECFSAEYDLTMLKVDLSQIIEQPDAHTLLMKVFELANQLGNAVIFLDECDRIARSRDELKGDSKLRPLINGLFTLMDAMEPGVLCFAATNVEYQLDTAFLRRFDPKLKFLRPNAENIESAIEKFVSPKFTYVKDADERLINALHKAAQNYTGLSYAEIEQWVLSAEKIAAIEHRTEFTQSEVYAFLMDSMGFELHSTEFHGDYVYKVGNTQRG